MISLFPFPHISALGLAAAAGWATVGAAGLAAARVLRQELRSDRILCLLYHRVVPEDLYQTFRGSERIFSVSEERFARQLDWLRDQGHGFISLDQLVDHLRDGAPLPDKPVFISFDDGCESVHSRALPILQERDVPATVFVTTDDDAFIFHEGEHVERRMSPEEIRACEEAGLRVESHARSHRGLNEMSRDEALAEMRESREILTAWIGRPVRYFSVPLNFYNRRTLRQAREAGYDAVCVCDGATSNGATSPYRIRRFIVEGCWDLQGFERGLRAEVIAQRRVVAFLKKLPPKILGERRWMPLRARIFASPLGAHLGFHDLRRALAVAGVVGLGGLVLVSAAAVVLP